MNTHLNENENSNLNDMDTSLLRNDEDTHFSQNIEIKELNTHQSENEKDICGENLSSEVSDEEISSDWKFSENLGR